MRTRSRQAAVLAFSRRTNARPCLNILTQDAVALVAEVRARTELSGAGHVVDGHTLSLRILSSELDAEPIGAVVHESPLRGEDSMAGYALAMAVPVASNDLKSETRFHNRFLCNLGIGSTLTVPLHQNKEPFGSLGVYCRQPRQFTVDNLQFAETIAHLLTSSIARVKAEEALHQERSLAAAILDAVQSLIVVLDADGKIVEHQPELPRRNWFFDRTNPGEAVRQRLRARRRTWSCFAARFGRRSKATSPENWRPVY